MHCILKYGKPGDVEVADSVHVVEVVDSEEVAGPGQAARVRTGELDLKDDEMVGVGLVGNAGVRDVEVRLADTYHGLVVVDDKALLSVRDGLVVEGGGLEVEGGGLEVDDSHWGKMAVDSYHVKLVDADNSHSVEDNALMVGNGQAVDNALVAVDNSLVADSGPLAVDNDHTLARWIFGHHPVANSVDYYQIHQLLLSGLSCWGHQSQHHCFFSSAVVLEV